MVDVLAFKLLRRKIRERSHHLAADGVQAYLGGPRYAEIHQLHDAPVLRYDDVVRFDVSVDKPLVHFSVERVIFGVGIVERLAHRICRDKGHREREPAAGGKKVADRRAVNEFHFDKGDLLFPVADVVDLDDVRVMYVGKDLRFCKKPLPRFLIRRVLENFERPGDLKAFVPDLVHARHSAFAHKLGDPVVRHDLLVSSTGKLMQGAAQLLQEDVGKDFADVPGVGRKMRNVEGIRFLHTDYEGHTIALKAFDEPDPSRHYWLFDVRDTTRGQAGQALYHSADPTVLVSTNFVLHFGKKTGDTITLQTPGGPTFRVAAVVTRFASPKGVVYLARERYKALWKDRSFGLRHLRRAGGRSEGRARRARCRFGRSKNLMFMLNEEFRGEFASDHRPELRFADVLESAALFVALISIFNTLTVGVLARSRELGMMRGESGCSADSSGGWCCSKR